MYGEDIRRHSNREMNRKNDRDMNGYIIQHLKNFDVSVMISHLNTIVLYRDSEPMPRKGLSIEGQRKCSFHFVLVFVAWFSLSNCQ